MFSNVCVSIVVYLHYNLVALIVGIKHVASIVQVGCQMMVYNLQ